MERKEIKKQVQKGLEAVADEPRTTPDIPNGIALEWTLRVRSDGSVNLQTPETMPEVVATDLFLFNYAVRGAINALLKFHQANETPALSVWQKLQSPIIQPERTKGGIILPP